VRAQWIARGCCRGHWISRGSWRGATDDMDRSIEHARSIRVFLYIVCSLTHQTLLQVDVNMLQYFVMLLELNQQIKQENTSDRWGEGGS